LATAVVAAVVAALTIGVSTQIFHRSPSSPQFALTAGAGFTITSTISSSSTSQTPANLDIGAQRYLWYNVANPLSVPITVTSMSISAVTPPAGCAVSNLDLSGTSFAGTLLVPKAVGATDGTGAVAVPIKLINETGTQQNNPTSSTENCANKTFGFTYTGMAQYTDTTTTTLVASPNPSNSGQSVTFTATIAASNASADTANPSGTVNFYSCTTVACGSTTLLASPTISGGQATFSTTSLSNGSFIEAVYQGDSTNFAGSTSNVVTQMVNSSGTASTTTLTSSPNPSTSGQSVTFTADVNKVSGSHKPTGTVNFYSCTSVTGPCTTQIGTGTLGSNGSATFTTSTLSAGSHFIEAIYQGDSTFAGSTSNIVTQVVGSLATTTGLTSAPNPSSLGASVTFTATVARVSGTGSPTGTVNFYKCTSSSNCTTTAPNLLGSGSLSSGKATFTTSTLPVGNTFVEAVYQGVSGSFTTSNSNIVTQVVVVSSTSTALTSNPNPSLLGQSVTLSATVTKTAGSATPTGSVSFFSGAPTPGTHTLLGTGTLNASAQATLNTSGLTTGEHLFAVYGGATGFTGSTSPVITQTVISPPASCTGSFSNFLIGSPPFQILFGNNGNSFIYAFGGNYLISGGNGNDCIDAGDGNNAIGDGNGNDVVGAGNGDNGVLLGNGTDNVTLGNGSNIVGAGNGTDHVTVGNGSHNEVILGNGTDTVTIGTGSNNTITLGNGTDTVTIQSAGSNDTINGGQGNETIFLGSGTNNTFKGGKGHNTCHIPTGKTVSSLHDTVTNCTVVSP
jgi:hypothetical protein